MLALIFRGNAHWTLGFSFARALDYLHVPYLHIDNNAVWNGEVNLSLFDAAICVDDGFALKPRILQNMPSRSAYFSVDLHGEPDAYLPFLHQFGKVYCAQYSYGVKIVEASGQQATHLPLAWDNLDMPYTKRERDVPIAMVASWSTEMRILWREIINHKYKGQAVEAYHQDVGDLYSSAKIGLNLLGGSGHNIFYNHCNMRIWEICGGGALLLQQDLKNPYTGEHIPDMEMVGLVGAQAWFRNADATHHFWDRRHLRGDENCVMWHDASQLLYTLDYYLASENEAERAALARRGQEWAQGNTYVARAKVILDELGVAYREG